MAEGPAEAPPGSVPLQPHSARRSLDPAEVTVLAAQLGGHLGPLLTQPYVIGAAFLPAITDCLKRAKGSESDVVRSLALALRVSRLPGSQYVRGEKRLSVFRKSPEHGMWLPSLPCSFCPRGLVTLVVSSSTTNLACCHLS